MKCTPWILGLICFATLGSSVGCGGSSSTTAPTPNTTFTATVSSAFKKVYTLNNGVNLVGINDLTGTSSVSGQAVQVEVLADVNYSNNSGPFGGSVNVTYPDGSIESFSQSGIAAYDSTTQVTTFNAKLEYVGGTGEFANLKGSGTYIGTRSTALGGAVTINVQAYVHP